MCSNKTDDGPVRVGKTIFSLSELKKLLEEPNACVSCVACQRSIYITPMRLADLKTSIRDLLEEKVNKYDVELQGMILAHKNVKIVAGSVVLSDSRQFPLEYIADVYVFKPVIGGKLRGVVNKMPLNREYVSVLVHNIFNVLVYAGHKQPKPAVSIGSFINVTVTYIDFTRRPPFIRAELSSENLNELGEADGAEEEISPPLGLTGAVGKRLSSILKNSPARVRQSSTEVETESSCAETESRVARRSVVDGTEIRKKKKKKKDKEKKDETVERVSEETKRDESPSKKRKRSHDDSESSSPSKKKKKKKHSVQNLPEELVANGNTSLNDTPINPLESTVQIMADQSIFKAASSTPVLKTPSKKKKSKKSVELSEVQQAAESIKSELKTADSGISSSDEKKVKIKRELESSDGDGRNSTKRKSVDGLSPSKDESKKKKKKKEKKVESSGDINRRLLLEAMKELKTEK